MLPRRHGNGEGGLGGEQGEPCWFWKQNFYGSPSTAPVINRTTRGSHRAAEQNRWNLGSHMVPSAQMSRNRYHHLVPVGMEPVGPVRTDLWTPSGWFPGSLLNVLIFIFKTPIFTCGCGATGSGTPGSAAVLLLVTMVMKIKSD